MDVKWPPHDQEAGTGLSKQMKTDAARVLRDYMQRNVKDCKNDGGDKGAVGKSNMFIEIYGISD